jgi:signal peptide peptidase SppA
MLIAIEEGAYYELKAKLESPAYAPAIAQAIAGLRSPEAATSILPAKKTVGAVAVVSLSGFMTQKPNIFSMIFGGTSTEAFAREVVAAMNDPKIGAVVMAGDSPGGSVHGVEEAAAAIRGTRGQKPLVAVASPMAASAAYWLLSQADPGALYTTPSGITGSIGAMVEHADVSEALAKEGIKLTVIKYGVNKAEGHPSQALGEDALAHAQATVNRFGQQFEADVAKGRGVTEAKVRKDFGQGRTFHAEAAKEAGLVDGIASLESVLTKLSGRKVESVAAETSQAAYRAEADALEL